MTYVIAEPCIDVMDRACVEECPVDCIYEGGRSLYIHPDECIDCGACEPVCPVEAIYYEADLPARWEAFTDDNARFFHSPLPGASAALGDAGRGRASSAGSPPTPNWSVGIHIRTPPLPARGPPCGGGAS